MHSDIVTSISFQPFHLHGYDIAQWHCSQDSEIGGHQLKKEVEPKNVVWSALISAYLLPKLFNGYALIRRPIRKGAGPPPPEASVSLLCRIFLQIVVSRDRKLCRPVISEMISNCRVQLQKYRCMFKRIRV